jgi:hypothetical protein
MRATESAVEVDGAALVVSLWSRASVGFVTEDNPATVGKCEPAFEAHCLSLKDVWPAEKIPKLVLACMQ